MNLTTTVTERGGLAATFELLHDGATSYALTRAVATGELIRVRQGWYALPDRDPLLLEAVRVGGRLTCCSGARWHGLWVSRTEILHVRVGSHDSRLRTRHSRRVRLAGDRRVRVHWGAKRSPGTRFALLPRECLWDMMWCQSPERVVAAADAALHLGLLTKAEWEGDIESLPKSLRSLLRGVDARSDSIIESIVRFRLVQLGYLPRVQVRIRGVGRVDLILGHRLVIELDGWEFHNTRDQFEADRQRDAILARKGYRVLRFTYRQVTRRWHEVLGAIQSCLA